MTTSLDLGVHNLRSAYRAGTLDCRTVIDEVLKRIAAAGDDRVWISRAPDAALQAQGIWVMIGTFVWAFGDIPVELIRCGAIPC